MQDRLDGGLSVLIRCPGSDLPSSLAFNKLTVDLYVTPRELVQNEHVSGDAAVLVQAFCKDFALPHLERFVERCKIESMRIPKPRGAFPLSEYQYNLTNFTVVLAESVNINGPNHLPAFASPLSSRIQCRASAEVKPEDDIRCHAPNWFSAVNMDKDSREPLWHYCDEWVQNDTCSSSAPGFTKAEEESH